MLLKYLRKKAKKYFNKKIFKKWWKKRKKKEKNAIWDETKQYWENGWNWLND
jgi:hypothetical protein